MWKTIGNWIGGGVASLLVYLAYENWPVAPPNISWREKAMELATDPAAQVSLAPLVLLILLFALYIRKFGFSIDRFTPLSKLFWFALGVGTLLPIAVHSLLGTADPALDELKGGSFNLAVILVIATWLMLKRIVRILRDGEPDPFPKWPTKNPKWPTKEVAGPASERATH